MFREPMPTGSERSSRRSGSGRISLLVALPLAKLETASLVTKLRDIGTEPTGVTIYHNPNCGTSRNTLALIRNAGIDQPSSNISKHRHRAPNWSV
jgi:hypothetical protein